jgi:hypothetical protein
MRQARAVIIMQILKVLHKKIDIDFAIISLFVSYLQKWGE